MLKKTQPKPAPNFYFKTQTQLDFEKKTQTWLAAGILLPSLTRVYTLLPGGGGRASLPTLNIIEIYLF